MSAEFASAAMVRVLTQGLRELGLPPLAKHISFPGHGDATVDLDLKLAVVQHAIKHGGVGCLIHLGCGVHRNANEPTHRAMMSARDPLELVIRWQRLERYIHSRHRLRIVAHGEQWLHINHVGVKDDIWPTLYESLVVFGVIAALLQARGVQGLVIRSGSSKVFPEAPGASMEKWPQVDPLRFWHLSWKSCARPLTSTPPVGAADELYANSDWPQWQKKLVNYILERLIDTPTATDAAHKLGVSLRSLQRTLKQRELSYSALVGDCRARMAAMHLIQSELPLAEVGFLCGYSDQSHFTREFSKRVGMPPQKYRTAFGMQYF